MRSRGVCVAAVIAAVACVGVFVPAAAAAVQCGDQISQDTVLTQDLTNCAGNGLVITADDVTLDLNGRTIDGDGTGPDHGILVGVGREGVTIRDGEVTEFGNGVSLGSDGEEHRLLSLRLADNATGVLMGSDQTDSLFSRLQAVDGAIGFETQGSNHRRLVFEATSASENATGYRLSDVDDTLFQGISAQNNRDHGILLDDASSGNFFNTVLARGNQVGIDLRGPDQKLLRVRALGNEENGIGFQGPNTQVVLSQAKGNGHTGITAFPGADTALLFGNSADGNGLDGILIGGQLVRLRNNRANGNGDDGFDVLHRVINLGGNTAKGNGDQACEDFAC